MRLGILLNEMSPWSRDTAVELTRNDHEVHVLRVRNPPQSESYVSAKYWDSSEELAELNSECAMIHDVNGYVRNRLQYVLAAPMIRKILRRHHVEALLTLYGGGFAGAALLSGFRPYAVYAVGSDILLQKPAAALVAKASLASADVVFANGSYLASRAKELAPGANVVPLLLGVDTDLFSPRRNSSKAPIRIVCTRGFEQVYNNEYILRALALLRAEQLPDFQVVFVSGGSQLEECKSLANQILPPSLNTKVRFLGGVCRKDLVTELSSSDIFVSVSKSDGTSTALLEAMSCGLVPILSDIPQHREWIDTARGNGYLVPMDSHQEFARILQKAIADHALARGVSDFNRQLVLTRADRRANIAQLSRVLRSMLK
jgi:glycosyltransferase involved in cell wall biosynthesis